MMKRSKSKMRNPDRLYSWSRVRYEVLNNGFSWYRYRKLHLDDISKDFLFIGAFMTLHHLCSFAAEGVPEICRPLYTYIGYLCELQRERCARSRWKCIQQFLFRRTVTSRLIDPQGGEQWISAAQGGRGGGHPVAFQQFVLW